MNINDISTQLLYTTVPIITLTEQGSTKSGTGFIFSIQEKDNRSIPLLVTNYHVLEGAIGGFFELHEAYDGKPSDKTIKVQFDRTIINNNKLEELDAIAIPLAGTFMDLKNRGIQVFFRTVDQNMIPSKVVKNDFAALENIVFIGYPNSIYDITNKIPVIRKGITATPIWNDFQGRKEFLIDAGVFPGSSGSPVFIFNQGAYPTKDGLAVGNRLLFVGMVSGAMVKSGQDHNDYLDLGIVINSDTLFKRINQFVEKLK